MWGMGELSLWWMVVGGVWLWEEKLLLLLLPILLPIFIIGNGGRCKILAQGPSI